MMWSPKTTAVCSFFVCACARADAERHDPDGLVVIEDGGIRTFGMILSGGSV